jgi:uncharacterized RDD family membrane protein YckC
MPTCPSCHGEVPPGLRWCSICHASLVQSVAGRLAPPGKRLGAYALDVAIPLVALFAMMNAAGASGFLLGSASGGSSAGVGTGLLVGFALLIAYAIWALKLFARGTTPGKNMLGMRVIKESGEHAGFGTMLIREWIGKWISGLILGLGYIWILLDRDRQGWHDKLVSTYVVE